PVWISGVEQDIQPVQAGGGKVIGRPNGQFATDGYRTTGASGELELGDDPAYPISIGVLLTAARMHEIGGRLCAVPNPVALIWAGLPGAERVGSRVDQLHPVRFQLRHHDGSPAQRAQVRLGAGDSPGIGLGYVADQAGAVTVLLPVFDNIMLAGWQ